VPGDPTERAIDALVANLDYPMYVVTASGGGERAGCLVGFASQVAISPARWLVAVSVHNHTYRVAQKSPALAVHVLRRDQMDLAELFGARSGDDVDKFSSCRWWSGPYGLPILSDCPAWTAGPVLDRVSFGDHVGHVIVPQSGGSGLEVGEGGGRDALRDADRRRGQREAGPLMRFTDVHHLEPGHPA
jgi:flavin reductase (DIM6/NTAB) family NADH-FMN oxidoreductase RutF